jgi:hypothetical protein
MKFEEGSGDSTHDSSGYGDNGTCSVHHNDPAYNPWTSNGYTGGGIQSNGEGRMYDDTGTEIIGYIPHVPRITVAAWVKPDSGGYNEMAVAGRDGINSINWDHTEWLLKLVKFPDSLKGYRLAFEMKQSPSCSPGVPAYGVLAGLIPFNTWSHIAGTYDGDSIRIYANGVNIGTIADSPAFDTISDCGTYFNIGHRKYRGEYKYRGKIDEVRVYNRALSESEINELAGNLVAYYPLDGNANNFLGTGYNGVIHGATSAIDRKGNSNSALSFDGVDDFVSVLGDPLQQNYSVYSVNLWFKTSSSPTQTLFMRSDTTSDNAYIARLQLKQITSGIVNLDEYYPAGGGMHGKKLICDDSWHNIVIVRYNNRTTKIFVDGMLDNTQTNYEQYAGNSPNCMRIGVDKRKTFALRYFAGKIDDVRIYSVALSDSSVQNIWYEKPPTNNLICYYPFNGNADDSTINGYNGTVYGPVLTTDRKSQNNSAYCFDGINDYINIPFDPLGSNYNNNTISLWVKSSQTNNPFLFDRVDANDDYSTANVITLWPQTGLVTKSDDLPPSDGESTGSYLVNNGLWHNVTLVRNGSNRSVYIDGLLDSYEPNAEIYQGTTPLMLFFGKEIRQTTNRYPFVGSIDEIRIYKSALSIYQIRELNSDR